MPRFPRCSIAPIGSLLRPRPLLLPQQRQYAYQGRGLATAAPYLYAKASIVPLQSVQSFTSRIPSHLKPLLKEKWPDVDFGQLCRKDVRGAVVLARQLANSQLPDGHKYAQKILFAAVEWNGGDRIAALFILNSALSNPDNVRHAFKIPEVRMARQRVEEMASKDDVAAMALKAVLLENDGLEDETLDLYKTLFKPKYIKAWNREALSPDCVLSLADVYYRYHRFLYNTNDPNCEKDGLDKLKLAAQEGHHLDAGLDLIELHSHSLDRSTLHNLYLKLAATGHASGSHALARIYSQPESSWEMEPLKLRQSVAPIPWRIDGSLPEKLLRANDSNADRRLRNRFIHLCLEYSTLPNWRPPSGGRWLVEFAWRITLLVTNQAKRSRHFQALDWFHLGRIMGEYPSIIDGGKLAYKLGLPYEAWVMKQGLLHANQNRNEIRSKADREWNRWTRDQGQRDHDWSGFWSLGQTISDQYDGFQFVTKALKKKQGSQIT
jgi:hypothetical protein